MENINLFILVLAFMVMPCIIITIISIDNKKENVIEEQIDSNALSIRQQDVFEDLDNMINIYIANFIYENKLNGGEIYYNNDRLNKEAIELSTIILSDLSYHFKKKISLFMTTQGLYTYVTKTVMRQILAYASDVNRLK